MTIEECFIKLTAIKILLNTLANRNFFDKILVFAKTEEFVPTVRCTEETPTFPAQYFSDRRKRPTIFLPFNDLDEMAKIAKS